MEKIIPLKFSDSKWQLLRFIEDIEIEKIAKEKGIKKEDVEKNILKQLIIKKIKDLIKNNQKDIKNLIGMTKEEREIYNQIIKEE